MLHMKLPTEQRPNTKLETYDTSGAVYRPGPALHVKIDGNRVVERRATEMRRLNRQFHGVVVRPSRFQDDSVQPWLTPGFLPAQQRWNPRLERDLRAVCSEAGLSPATTTSVITAASRGIVPQNPGVLLSRMLRFLDCLTPPCGRRGVLVLLRSAPSLLRCSPESLRSNLEMLAPLLPEGTAPAVVVKFPALLTAAPITLWGNFEGLRRLLRLDHDAASRLVERVPRLLLNSRGALEGRLEQLALLAGVTGRKAAALVARQPALLGYFPATLERNLQHAAEELGVPMTMAQRLLVRQPTLLMLSAATLSERLRQFRDTTGLHDSADLVAVVLRQPSLLTLSPETVRHKVAVVERVLGLGGQLEALRVVLRCAPQLLTLAAETLEAKAAALRRAVAPCPELTRDLECTAPTSVAMWLCMRATRYERVRQVAEVRAAARAAAERASLPQAAACRHELSAAGSIGLGVSELGGSNRDSAGVEVPALRSCSRGTRCGGVGIEASCLQQSGASSGTAALAVSATTPGAAAKGPGGAIGPVVGAGGARKRGRPARSGRPTLSALLRGTHEAGEEAVAAAAAAAVVVGDGGLDFDGA